MIDSRWRLGWRGALLAVAAGAVSAFAFQPFSIEPLMPLALAVLFWLLAGATRLSRSLLLGWLFGLGQFCVGLNWIATAFTFQAAMPAWLGWIAVVLLSLYLAVYPMLAVGIGWTFGRRSATARMLALAGAWALCEWLRATMFTGFAWNPVAAAAVGTAAHLVPLVGTYGASALMVLLGGALFSLTRWEWRPLAAVATAGILLGLAAPLVAPLRAERGTSVRVVQPNIGQGEKWRPGLDQEALARLGRLSLGGSPPPRLLLWPEVAVPVAFQAFEPGSPQPPLTLPAVRQAAAYLRPGDLLVTGAFAVAIDRQGAVTGETNSVMPIHPGGQILGRYDKAHLVPYGEYLPMRPLLSRIGLSQLAPGVGDTRPGPGPRTLDLPGFGKAGIQVCYEMVFSGEVVDRANRPDFIFNPSNDAWFGRWGPPQHLAQSRLRAAEEGIPVIRSTPTGISAIVDARGALLASLPWRTAGVIDGRIPPATVAPTPFARLGNLLPILLGFALIIVAIVLDGRRRYMRGT